MSLYIKYIPAGLSPGGGGGGGGGNVSSVGLSDGSSTPIYSISNSPVTTTGVLTFSLVAQTANTVFAGPATGSADEPGFRSLVTADLPFAIGNLTAVGTDGIAVTSGTGAVIGSGTSLAQHVADASHNGYLSSTDWSTFNSKQAAGNYITALTGDGSASGPGSAALTLATVNTNVGSFGSASSVSAITVNGKGLVTAAASTSIQIAESQVTNLVSDLAGKQAALTIGNLTDAGTDGITVTGGTGAVIGSGTSIAQRVADTTHNGYLSSTDWNTFNGKGSGSVTSVTFTGDGTVLSNTPSSAVTTTGTVTASLNTQTARTFLTGPLSGSAAAPTFKALTAPTVQSFTASSGTYTTPTNPPPLYLIVEIVGGGGGGGCSGTSGGTAAGDGADSTFSVHSGAAILTAGKGLKGAYNSDGGAGGAATVAAGATKIIAVSGGAGGGAESQGSAATSATPRLTGGMGGNSFFGGAGRNGAGGGTGAGGAAATNSGSGGGGAEIGATNSAASGSGGGAGAFIKALITSPSTSYDYAVGAGGSGQVTVNGQAGGAGAAGYIVVTEYYQ